MSTCCISTSQIAVDLTTTGGTLASVRDLASGTEYLWGGDPEYWAGQAPICFPICGGLREGRATTADGREVSMARHGIVRKREWQLESCDESHATMLIASDDETRAQFPFDFELRARYAVDGRTLSVSYDVANSGDEELPFFVGGHPAFRCPFAEGDAFEDCYLEFERPESCTVATSLPDSGLADVNERHELFDGTRELALRHDLFHVDAQLCDQLESRRVRLLSHRSAGGLEVSFADFPYLVIWSASNDAPFVALEPWTGLSTCLDEGDVLEEKRNVQRLAPGASRSYEFQVTLL